MFLPSLIVVIYFLLPIKYVIKTQIREKEMQTNH